MAHTLDPKEPTLWLRACELDSRLRQLRDDVDKLLGEVDAFKPLAIWALNETFLDLGRAERHIRVARRALAEMNEEEAVP